MQEHKTPLDAAQWLQKHVKGTLTADSRKVAAGDGFIAWPGVAVDGRSFVPQALAQGAEACLVEAQGADSYVFSGDSTASMHGLKALTGEVVSAFFDTPSAALEVIAITGTNGKTSTAWWLAQALSAVGGVHGPCGVVGTLGVGQPPDVLATGLTTPDPVRLQQTFQTMRQLGYRSCAIEASSIGIEEHRLAGTQIRTAVFTNLTQDHLDYHASMQAYAQAKRKLFAWPGLQSAVVNIDDPYGAVLAKELGTGALDVWSTSVHQSARLVARSVVYGNAGLQFDVQEGETSATLQTRVIGEFNIANLLSVIAAMRSVGVSLHDAVAACQSLQPVPGRMECVGGVDQPLVAVDYAHTPDALSKALVALRPVAAQRGGALWCIFGCGGDRDAAKRPLMGCIAAQHADQVVLTSDNPRSEKPEAIIAQILRGQCSSKNVSVQTDRALAIAETVQKVAPADVILLAGKGHETTQEVAGQKYAFVDKEHAQRALAQRGLQVGVDA
jgi:UDP-N-acetylmuramoyl-L-alanyl-D-glutamate--2,6-diaminopimelate ligase